MPAMPLLVLLAEAAPQLWPLRAPALMRFGTEPMLVSQLRRFQSLGFTEVVIVADESVAHEVRGTVNARIRAMHVQVIAQPEADGIADALLRVAPLLRDRPRTPLFLARVHDLFDDGMAHQLLKAFHNAPTESFISGYDGQGDPDDARLIVSPSGRLAGVVDPFQPARMSGTQVNLYAHIHADAGRLLDLLDELHRFSPTDGGEIYFRALDTLAKQHPYRVQTYRGPWYRLCYPWHVLDMMSVFLARIQGRSIAESAQVSSAAHLSGDIFVGERVSIAPGAVIIGPTYIGANSIIGHNTLIRGSMLLNQVQIGFGSEVARSYIGDQCSLHTARALDSVLAPGVNLSAGCTTANLRIDREPVKSVVDGQRMATGRDKLGAIIGQEAFLAVNTLTMPGVKIGPHAQIGPGTQLRDDVRDGQRVFVSQEHTIIEADNDKNVRQDDTAASEATSPYTVEPPDRSS